MNSDKPSHGTTQKTDIGGNQNTELERMADKFAMLLMLAIEEKISLKNYDRPSC